MTTQDSKQSAGMTLPIYLLIGYVICTFFPVIYTFLPFLGEISAVLLIGIAIVIAYFASKENYHNETVQNHSLFKAWTWFIIFMAIGILWSGDRGRSQFVLEGCAKYFIMLVIMVRILDNYRRLDFVIRMFGLCAVGMAFFTVFNYATGRLLGGGYRGMALDVGIFADPNDLNLLLNAALPFVVFSALNSRKKKMAIMGIVIIVTAIMLSFSRGAFLGLSITGFGYYIFFAKGNKKVILYLGLAVILFFMFAPSAYIERLTTIYNWQKDVNTGLTGTRLDSWKRLSIYGLRENPIFGLGPGMSLYAAGTVMRDWHNVHNSFIQVFVDLGLTGFVCYVMLFVIPFREYRSLVRSRILISPLHLNRMKATILSFIGYGVTNSFLPQAYAPILFMLTGFFIVQSELIKKSTNKPSGV